MNGSELHINAVKKWLKWWFSQFQQVDAEAMAAYIYGVNKSQLFILISVFGVTSLNYILHVPCAKLR